MRRTTLPCANCGRGADAHAAPAQQLQPHIERDLAERDDDLHARQLGDFGLEVIEAARDLLGQRLVVGRRAAHRHDDVRVVKSEPVVDAAATSGMLAKPVR